MFGNSHRRTCVNTHNQEMFPSNDVAFLPLSVGFAVNALPLTLGVSEHCRPWHLTRTHG
jgi:hypothetical protein